VIAAAGLPVPMKSSCFFRPASKKHEIVWLKQHHPELLERALAVERNARDDLTSAKGLGRPFSWEGYLVRLNDTPLFPDPPRPAPGLGKQGSALSPLRPPSSRSPPLPTPEAHERRPWRAALARPARLLPRARRGLPPGPLRRRRTPRPRGQVLRRGAP